MVAPKYMLSVQALRSRNGVAKKKSSDVPFWMGKKKSPKTSTARLLRIMGVLQKAGHLLGKYSTSSLAIRRSLPPIFTGFCEGGVIFTHWANNTHSLKLTANLSPETRQQELSRNEGLEENNFQRRTCCYGFREVVPV